MGLSINWAPTVAITDFGDGSAYFEETGTFYDEISPQLSLLWDFKTVSFGGLCRINIASDAFVTGQPTKLIGLSVGGVFIYNYVMHEGGDWLFPMILDGGWQTYRISYRPSIGDFVFDGQGWNLRASFGVERVWSRKYSIGLTMGRRFSRAEFRGDEYGISPCMDGDGWFFAVIGRFGFAELNIE